MRITEKVVRKFILPLLTAEVRQTTERERRFLVKRLPDNLLEYEYEYIPHQGYFRTDDNISLRIRKKGGEHIVTRKIGDGSERPEREMIIPKKKIYRALKTCIEDDLTKTRFPIPYEFGIVELDIFHGNLKGLAIAEIEFASTEDKDSFEPLEWFGQEITGNKSYTNRNLARYGIPIGTPLHKTKKYRLK